ncbi:TetR-like C-terminal domain-containing protein [Terrilactibacillus sp. S3-3]|nr:TetR-like C-terminal domain-containing protein [Terrilactibacillus sp. S3-3]
MPDPTDSEFEQESDKILKLLGKVMEGYHLDHEEAIHAVRGLRSIAHGFSSLELNHGFNMNASKQKSLRWMLEAYMTGMKAMKKSNVLK